MPPKKIKNLDDQSILNMPQLNIFGRQTLQVSVEGVSEEEILPMSSWDQASEIGFNVYGDPESFVDPSSLRVSMEVRVVRDNGQRLPFGRGSQDYAVIANFGSSVFEKVSVRVGNSTQISGLDSLYPYLTYLENVFKTPTNVKRQVNFPYVLYPDSEVFFDRLDENRNEGYKSRHNACVGSRTMYVSVPIHSPITGQDKLLIPGVDMHIRMVRATPNFLLMNRMTETVMVKKKVTKAATATEAAKETIQEVEEAIDIKLKIEICKYVCCPSHHNHYIFSEYQTLGSKVQINPTPSYGYY